LQVELFCGFTVRTFWAFSIFAFITLCVAFLNSHAAEAHRCGRVVQVRAIVSPELMLFSRFSFCAALEMRPVLFIICCVLLDPWATIIRHLCYPSFIGAQRISQGCSRNSSRRRRFCQ
jgi:hypothetical protein